MNIKMIACVLSIFALSACGSGSSNKIIDPITGKEISAAAAKKTLSDNKQKWALKNIKSYQYTQNTGCFCMREMYTKKQITVSEGVVTEAFFLDTSEYLTPEQFRYITNIDELFDIAEDAINSADRVEVLYNKEYGYPERISIDYKKDAVDDEITYFTSDLM